MRSFKTTQFAAIAVLLTAAMPMAAQQPDAQNCTPTAARVRGNGADGIDLDALGGCPKTGPAALAHAWRTKAYAGLLPQLTRTSARLRDAAVYRAVLEVAGNGSSSAAERLGALTVLTSYYDPSLAPSREWLTADGVDGPIPVVAHFSARDGATGLPASRFREIAELLARISSDPDPLVRRGAGRLRQQLAWLDPATAILPPGAISLLADCDLAVALRSTADIGISLQLRVLGTSYDRTFSIIAGKPDRPSQVLLAAPAGVIVAYKAGVEVARLTERKASCRASDPR